MKIWQKMILKEVLITLFFTLLCFYLLYSLLDYSMHMRDFQSASFSKCLLYYFYHFIKRLELLLPIAFMLALIRCLEKMNKHYELIALQVTGLSFKTLVRPLFFLALSLSTLVYCNEEWLLPSSMNFIDYFQKSYLKKSHKQRKVNVLSLKGGDKLVYQTYDASSKTYGDVFYLPSNHDIYCMRSLQKRTGFSVEHFTKDEKGFYALTHSYPRYYFEHLDIPSKTLKYLPPENRSLSSLSKLYFSAKTPEVAAKFYYKLSTPLFCLFVMFLIVPYTFCHERGHSSFSLYVFGLFGFMIYFMLINFAKILGINGVISPSMSFPLLIGSLAFLSVRKILQRI